MFTFESILDHCRGKGRKYEVLVQLTTGKEMWEPLRTIIKEDPITLATYAAEHNLLDKEQWKCLQSYHCQETYILKLITRALAGYKCGVHYKFGVQVPNDYAHAVSLINRTRTRNGKPVWTQN